MEVDLKTIVLLIVVSFLNIFPQIKNGCSSKVKEFMQILEQYQSNLNSVPLPEQFYLSDEELDSLLKKMYAAIEDDPEGYSNYLIRKYQEWKTDIKEGKISEDQPNIGNVEALIRKKIANKYSRTFLSVITTPYFLRVKITSKSPGDYKDLEGKTHDQINVIGEIEEVLKGEKKFNVGESVNFMYLNKLTTCLRNYDIGKSYFIPFMVTTLEYSRYKGLNPQWYDCKGNYLIENNMITIPDDYFELGEKLYWNEFKSKFIEKYIIQ